jgi:hypothetical protein
MVSEKKVCIVSSDSSSSSSANNMYAIIGGAVGAVVVLAIAIVIAKKFCFTSKKEVRSHNKNSSSMGMATMKTHAAAVIPAESEFTASPLAV